MLKMLISPWIALIVLIIVVIAATIAFIFVKHNMKEEDYIEILNRLEDMAHTSDSISQSIDQTYQEYNNIVEERKLKKEEKRLARKQKFKLIKKQKK